MADLRYNHFAITFDLIVVADVFPATWPSIKAYWGSQASDPNNFRSFRTGVTFINQPVMTVITAGTGNLRLLKKYLVATFTTDALNAIAAEGTMGDLETCDWRA